MFPSKCVLILSSLQSCGILCRIVFIEFPCALSSFSAAQKPQNHHAGERTARASGTRANRLRNRVTLWHSGLPLRFSAPSQETGGACSRDGPFQEGLKPHRPL